MNRNYVAVLLLSVVATSCHVAVSPSNTYLGRLTGMVTPIDVDNYPMTGQYSGTTVTIEGTSFRTLSDANGTWTIDNVPAAANYTLVFQRSGFDTTRFSIHNFTGSGVDFVDTTFIIHIPTDSVILDSILFKVDSLSYPNLKIKWLAPCGHTSPSNKLELIVFGASVSNPSDSGFGWFGEVTTNGKFVGYIYGGYNSDSLQQTEKGRSWFSTGQTVYVQAEIAPVPTCFRHNAVYTNAASKHSNTIVVKIP
jgi:hypothetical protein